VQTVQRLSVTIPAGVDEGQQVRLSGEGEVPPRGGAPGDLYVAISVAPHPVFKRQGTDILYEHAINVAQAALGDEVDVPTVDGSTVRLRVPSGTQTGKVLRLRERGVPNLRGGARGDQLVRVRVAVPQDLTPEQRRLFQELARSFGTPGGGETASGAAPNGAPKGEPSTAGDGKTARPGGSEAGQQRPQSEGQNGGGTGGGKDRDKKKGKGLFDKILGGE
jgi:molecular chaperone DnaJ